MDPRDQVDRTDLSAACHSQQAIVRLDLYTRLLELQQRHVEVARRRRLELRLPTGGADRHRISACLEVVRGHGVLARAELVDAVDDQVLGARALDPSAEPGKEARQIL